NGTHSKLPSKDWRCERVGWKQKAEIGSRLEACAHIRGQIEGDSACRELACTGDVGSGGHAGVIIDGLEGASWLQRRRREAPEEAGEPEAHAAFVCCCDRRHSDHRAEKCRREGSDQCASRGRRLFHICPRTGKKLCESYGSLCLHSSPSVRWRARRQSRNSNRSPILFILGGDIGWMQPSRYHRGRMVREPPNIERIGNEGDVFMDYVAMQSCPSGRNAFFPGMYPLRPGMIPPQLPGSSSWLRTGTPAIAKFLLDLGYNTGEFGKNHLGDHAEALPTAHGIQEYWGYLYHLDAMQMVSFPDINKNPTTQAIVPPCRNTPVPGLPEVPGAVDPNATAWVPPPRPIISCKSSDGTQQNQMCSDEGPLTLERSKREFAAFGASNISSALSQGFAVTGADSRTAVGVAAGGRTQMTGLVAAATIAAVLLFLTEPLRFVPVAALGAVLIFAAFSLFDVGTLREIWKYDRLEVGLSVI